MSKTLQRIMATVLAGAAMAAGTAWAQVGVVSKRIDFNNDFKSDLVWSGPNGATGIWLMDGNSWQRPAGANVVTMPQGAGTMPAGGVPILAGDMSGDGTADIVWKAPTSNGSPGSGYWLSTMSGYTLLSNRPMYEGPGWQPQALGDFNGDGKKDFFWYNPDNGQF